MDITTPREQILTHAEQVRALFHDHGRKTEDSDAKQKPYATVFLGHTNIGKVAVVCVANAISHWLVTQWTNRIDNVLVVTQDFQVLNKRHLYILSKRTPNTGIHGQGPYHWLDGLRTKHLSDYLKEQ